MRNIIFVIAFALGVSCTAKAQQNPLPAPTGSYAVGRTIFNWVDESRVDLLSPKGHREIPVWVWYPASPSSEATKSEWLPGLWGELFAAVIAPPPAPDKPASEKYPVNTIRSHSYTDAPILAGQHKYPVILFAPGYGSGPGEYASLIEDLVSRGYIVAGVVPTYFSLPIIPKPLLVMHSAMIQDRMKRNPQLQGRKPAELLSLLQHGQPAYYLAIAGTAHSFVSDMSPGEVEADLKQHLQTLLTAWSEDALSLTHHVRGSALGCV